MRTWPDLHYTTDARRDIDRVRRFLRRQPSGRPVLRMRELMKAIRVVRAHPELNSIRKSDPVTGLDYRRHNVAQFVIVYVYFKPCASIPKGMVSIRAIRHGSEEDVLWEVRECSADDVREQRLFTGWARPPLPAAVCEVSARRRRAQHAGRAEFSSRRE